MVQLHRQLREAKTKAVQGVFGHYLDPKVVEHLAESDNLVERLDVQERVMTAFFSDVASFTTILENLSATDLAALLNQYFTEMCEVIGLRVVDHQDPDDKVGNGFTVVIDARAQVAGPTDYRS